MFATWQEIDSTSLSGTAKMIRKSIHRDLEDVSFGHGRREEFGISMDFFFRRPSEANAFSTSPIRIEFFLGINFEMRKNMLGYLSLLGFTSHRGRWHRLTSWPLMQWVDHVDPNLLPQESGSRNVRQSQFESSNWAEKGCFAMNGFEV